MLELSMRKLNYTIAQLPGEQLYRDFLNKIEAEVQQSYRFYQEWRMNLGIPMQDIDALISDDNLESFNSMKNVEYELTRDGTCNNYAVLEMKHFRVSQEAIDKIVSWSSPAKELATAAALPFFVIKYYPKQENTRWEFTVYPANRHAQLVQEGPRHMSERQFVQFLFRLRNKQVPIELLKTTCAEKEHRLNGVV